MRTKRATTDYERENLRQSIHPDVLSIFDVNNKDYQNEFKCTVCDKIIPYRDAANHKKDQDHKKNKMKGRKKCLLYKHDSKNDKA